MKIALSKTGEKITASEVGPETAVCPRCGCQVVLRRRRQMGGKVTFFWRHSDNGHVPCSRRVKPYVPPR